MLVHVALQLQICHKIRSAEMMTGSAAVPAIGVVPLALRVIFLLAFLGRPTLASAAAPPELDQYQQHVDEERDLLSNTRPTTSTTSTDLRETAVDVLRQSPAINSNDDHHRSLQYGDGCPDILSSPLDPTSGSFGNVFSVRTVDGGLPVLVTSIDFYTDQTIELEYEVYTLSGPYKDVKTGQTSLGDISRWTLVASGRVIGEGADRVTPIPESAFTPVEVDGNGAYQSFYVTLTTPDIRYRPGTGSSDLQQAYAATDELKLIEGVGVILFPMPENVANFLAPRRFLGNVHYTSADTCPPVPSPRPTPAPTPRPTAAALPTATTRVLYTFSLQHDADVDQEKLLEVVDAAIENTLTRIMGMAGADLKSFADGDDLAIRGVVGFPVSSDEKCTSTLR